MKASGWDEDVAIDAMETTLRGHLDEQAAAQGLPPAVPVPEPRLADSPLYLDGGDRRVAVLGVMAAEVTSRAVLNAVRAATGLHTPALPAARDLAPT